MTTDRTDDDRSTDRLDAALDRRTFIAAGGTVGATMLAGCSSENETAGDSMEDGSDAESPDEETDDSTVADGGNFRLLISDMPADIGDFDKLDVSFDSARIFDGGGGTSDEGDDEEKGDDGETGDENGDEDEETEEEQAAGTTVVDPDKAEGEDDKKETDDGEAAGEEGAGDDDGGDEKEADENEESESEDGEDGGDESGGKVERRRDFYWLDLEGATVDLTRVVGDKATPVFEGGLSEGTYQKIELHVSGTEGVVDGEVVDVKVPSEKLQITHPFEVSADEPVEFVFDINVVKKGGGNGYNLKPVISESGVAGKDVEVEEVDKENGGEKSGDEKNGESGENDADADQDDSDEPADDEPDAEGDDTDGSNP